MGPDLAAAQQQVAGQMILGLPLLFRTKDQGFPFRIVTSPFTIFTYTSPPPLPTVPVPRT